MSSIEQLIAHYGAFAIFLGAGIEGETAVVAGGILSHQGYVPFWHAAIAAGLGSFVADQILFHIGRRFSTRAWVQRITGTPAYRRAIDTINRYQTLFVFGFRFLYGLRTVSPVAIGTTTISATRFLVINFVSAICWGIIFTGVGSFFGKGLHQLLRAYGPQVHPLVFTGLAFAALLIVLGVIRLVRTRRDAREGPSAH